MQNDSINIYEKLGPADEEGSLGTQELGKTHIGSESLALLDDASASSNRLRNLTNGFQTRLGRSPHSQGRSLSFAPLHP
jgi:uncharacterized Ntn-hydrolase superfamily protein